MAMSENGVMAAASMHPLWTRGALRAFVFVIAALGIALSLSTAPAFADEGDAQAADSASAEAALQASALSDSAPHAKRTILFYVCGSNLEEDSGVASKNILQVLNANFGNGEDVRFVVMTGGSSKWFMDSDRLVFPEGVDVPEDAVVVSDPDSEDEPVFGDPKSQVSGPYNQIWEAKSAGAADNPGKLVLLDGDGLKNGKAAETKEWMSDPETLRAFINYGVENFPAEKYDLILWDHGGGETGGFGLDFRGPRSSTMSFAEIIDALKDNAVTNRGDADSANDATFDFVNFDACLMGSTEVTLGIADYADYYIASPETIPGDGQVYGGWLDKLGKDPDTNGYELGKTIVDDFIAYYEAGYEDGTRSEATLAVIDTKALLDSGFVGALSTIGDTLKSQVESGSFYDELRSVKGSIKYDATGFFDLGNLVSQLGVALWELDADDVVGETEVDYRNDYTVAANKLLGILSNPEIVYARDTSGMRKAGRYFINLEEADFANTLKTSGLHLFFPLEHYPMFVVEYDESIQAAIEAMPKGDGRADFLKNYVSTMYEYNLALMTGRAVTDIVNSDSGIDRSSIGYEQVKEYWRQPSYPGVEALENLSFWGTYASALYEAMGNGDADGAEADVAPWLDKVIRQQAAEAVSADNVTARSVVKKNGVGSLVTIDNTRRRAVGGVNMNVVAELPKVREYINDNWDELHYYLEGEQVDLPLGTMSATMDSSMDTIEESTGDFLRDYVIWFNSSTTTTWNIDPFEDKWYAVKDAEGNLHVAAADIDSDNITVPMMRERGEDEPELLLLGFVDGKLAQVYLHDDEGNSRIIRASDLKVELKLTTALTINEFGYTLLPMSSTFTVSPDNVDDIELVYTDVDEIGDIADVDGDGSAFGYNYTVSDLYFGNVDITDKVTNPVGNLVDIKLATVEPATYTGKALAPKLVYDGKTLVEGVDYVWDSVAGLDSIVLPGDYFIDVVGLGDYVGISITTFSVKATEADIEAAIEAEIAISSELAKLDMAALEAGNAQALAAADTALATYEKLTDAQKTQVRGPIMLALLAVSQKAAAVKVDMARASEQRARDAQAGIAKNVKTVTVDAKTVTAAAVADAIAAVGGDPRNVATIVLGPKVKSVKASAFAACPKVTTLQVQTGKLTKASVKGSLKGSKVKRVIVNVAGSKAHAKLAKKYKKAFAKKNSGKKVKVQ